VRAEEKRLAVRVEDHPLEYADFEGVIPAGNYGAGSVIVWDRGTYRSFKPEPIGEQYARGKLELELFGHKRGGRWTLVRRARRGLAAARRRRRGLDRTRSALPRSVISGLTQEMRDAPGWLAPARPRRGAARPACLRPGGEHMLATPSSGRSRSGGLEIVRRCA
jgi:ATP-dependent DNA ligase